MDKAEAAFRNVANAYCVLVEGYTGAGWNEFQHELRKSLADLVAAAHALPAVEPTDADSRDSHTGTVAADIWKTEEHLRVQEYWLVFSPLDHNDHEPVCADLADDLADIWQDLQAGLLAANPTDAIWGWRFGFHSHWGSHATAALACLHRSSNKETNRPRGRKGAELEERSYMFIALKFHSDEDTPEKILQAIPIQWTRSWVKHEPAGQMKRKESGCVVERKLQSPDDPGDVLGALVDLLLPFVSEIKALRSLPGFMVEASISIYMVGDDRPPCHFQQKVVDGLAAIGAELDIDLYALPG
ncbi:MAG: DUF5063 domain-containing protein [Planctomycetota bacterium]